MEKITKPFVKITFEEIERAERFFENDKLLAEFLLAVTFSYREIDYKIKNKTVEKYFENFSKIIQNKKKSKIFGKKGVFQKLENQQTKPKTLKAPLKAPLEAPLKGSEKKTDEKTDEKTAKIDFQKLLDFINLKTKRDFRIINEMVKKKYIARLKDGYTKEDIINAIINAINDDYHKETNYKYLTPEFFSRAEIIDKYRAVTKQKTTTQPKAYISGPWN